MDSGRRLAPDAVTQDELARARLGEESWRTWAKQLHGEKRLLESKLASERQLTGSLRMRLTETKLKHLHAERGRLLAQNDLVRLKGRRWWLLHGALAGWQREPWRLIRLIGALARLVRPARLPPPIDLSDIDQRIAQVEAPPEAASIPAGRADTAPIQPKRSDSTLQEARRLFRAGLYEVALEWLDALPPNERAAQQACLIARDCYIKMGELQQALGEVRNALATAPSRALERQARQMLGRLRETDPAWLPDAGPVVSGNGGGAHNGRLLHLVKESLPYFERGYTIRSHATFSAQRTAGFEPVVVTSLGFPRDIGAASFPMSEVIDGVEHHRLDLGPDYRLDEVPHDLQLSDCAHLAGRLADRVRPALIQAGSGYRGYDTALVGLAVARRLGIPFVYEVRSFLEHTWTGEMARSETGELYRRRRQQELRCMLEADHVITIAEAMREEIVNRGIPRSKVSVVPNVVDVDRFTPRQASAQLRQKHGFEGRPVLGYISNLGPREGIEHLVRAVSLLREQGRNAAGLVVGDGPMRSQLEQLVKDLDLTNDVVITGHVENHLIEDYYALIDLFVVPRVADLASRLVTPLKPLEAMAMARPVLAADLPALRELVQPGERGEVFASGSAASLASTAADLLDDVDKRERLARAGMDWVHRERTIQANAKRFAETLWPLVAKGS